MDKNEIEKLRQIKTLPALIKYLRDELDWPISEDAIEDDVVFEYKAEELGLSSEYDDIVKEIKQIRPLSAEQPWGIFWVNFDKKKLPVVILRRILSKLVLKKRTSGAKAKQATWAMHDLLFISSYGEATDRAVTFAHFYQENKEELPILKVLGWDDGDTAPHLADAHKTLKEKLRWPEDPKNVSKWNADWASAFVLRHREVIDTTEKLVEELAILAKSIFKRAKTALKKETEKGPLSRLYTAFKETLIHDLDEDTFADVLAQTISYGLLTARFTSTKNINVRDLVDMVPKTNPFLKELLGTFLRVAGRAQNFDFDELGIQDVVELLNMAKVNAIKNDFGNKSKGEDPVIHFYEHFLSAYNKEQKIQRGVFYTPQPVVSYIVRSVHELLISKFGLEDGLASTVTWEEMLKKNKDLVIPKGIEKSQDFVQVLDPATGTATFLVEVIDVIHKTMTGKWIKQGLSEEKRLKLWNEYVPEHLLTRLHGFELMMAPYAIAHMKIGLKLAETGYEFASEERARIYLTNSLESAQNFSDKFDIIVPALAHEAHAVNGIKQSQIFTVVIGNPPYSAFGQMNKGTWILELIAEYKKSLKEKKINLDDDFIKFIRYSQLIIERANIGILMMITNNTFIDGLTHRQMRRSLMNVFNEIYVYDLHGSTLKGDVAPDGSKDDNVFNIKQGVSINCFVRFQGKSKSQENSVSHLWGNQEHKYKVLMSDSVLRTTWSVVHPVSPMWFFVAKAKGEAEYSAFNSLASIFPVNSVGILTSRDDFVLDNSKSKLEIRIKDFFDLKISDSALMKKYNIADNISIPIHRARREGAFDKNKIKLVNYRIFDKKYIYYSKYLLHRKRAEVQSHLLEDNIAIMSCRQEVSIPFYHAFCVAGLVDDCCLSNKSRERGYVFPLYLYGKESSQDSLIGLQEDSRRPNISTTFVDEISNKLDMEYDLIGKGNLKTSFGPEDVCYYVYALLYSPTYRLRYSEQLKIDFPRIPITRDKILFEKLVEKGNALVNNHLLGQNPFVKSLDYFNVDENVNTNRTTEVVKVAFSKKECTISINDDYRFNDVAEDIWCFNIGGYQVCEKWLKDRKGYRLSNGEIKKFKVIIVVIRETLAVMSEIDKVIDAHGGWPEAFE